MAKPKIVCICGTRPDAIKTAPVVLELRRFPLVETVLVSTGQHREMLDQALGTFGLKPDLDLGIMTPGQTLAQVTTRALEGIDTMIEDLKPDWITGQGDTTTTFVAALAAFYRRVPFAHIEAGLRTDTIDNPFPEEFNRRAAGQAASMHLAPTRWAAENLLAERVAADRVHVTGNTGIDALMQVSQSSKTWFNDDPRKMILLTTHRRENWGENQAGIARALVRILDAHPDMFAVVPMHRNPLVREQLVSVLGGIERCQLIEPPDYLDFVPLMKRAHLILTDSGGVQEEAPSFGIPVLVLRETTERPEGVEAGSAKLIGTDEDTIYDEAQTLLMSEAEYRAMSGAKSPYGDGRASARIRYLMLRELGIDSPEEEMWT